jgi:hypothetical protein
LPLTPEEKAAAKEQFDNGAFCPECGGLHFRSCPRVHSYRIRYKPENAEIVLEREVIYWPPGTWEDDVVFKDEIYDD